MGKDKHVVTGERTGKFMVNMFVLVSKETSIITKVFYLGFKHMQMLLIIIKGGFEIVDISSCRLL